MCGIVGIFHPNPDHSIDPQLLSQMNDLQTHRGPDESGIWHQSNIGLGSRRLAIVDIAHGQQPMANEDQSCVLTYNGELFNYLALRQELSSLGAAFLTHSDTEVVLRAYQQWGMDCVDHFNGQFAFALWDQKQSRLFLARDHAGIAPLHYYFANGIFVFASEAKAILEHPQVPRASDPAMIADLFTASSLFENRSAFAGIHTLEAGCSLYVNAQGLHHHTFWSLPTQEAEQYQQDPDLYAQTMLPMLNESLSIRNMGEVPWGMMLSGGTDSSTLSILANKFSPDPLQTFTIDFPNPWKGKDMDAHYAQLLAQQLQAQHHEFMVQPDDYFEVLSDLCWHLERPFNKGAASMYLLYRHIQGHAKVIQTGEGADELFAGYVGSKGLSLDAFQSQSPAPQNFPWAPHWQEGLQLFSPDFRQSIRPQERMQSFLHDALAQARTLEPLNQGLYLYMRYFLGELIELHDRTSLAFGVETRLPFMDKHFLEAFFPMPAHLKYQNGTSKYLFKQVTHDLLPPEIIQRKKTHLPIPRDIRSLKKQMDLAHDLLLSPQSRSSQYFDTRQIKDLLSQQGLFAETDMVIVWQLSLYLITLELHHQTFQL